MENLKTSLIQTHLSWENIQENLDHFAQIIQQIEETDLILLPEMFTTGFSMKPHRLAEKNNGKTLNWMQEQAHLKNAAISGSIIVQENGQYFNRLYFVFPDGRFQTYDKRHLFKFSGEDEHYAAGTEKLIVTYKDWRICPLICYDLRFPVWARNVENFDLLFYGANWPARRIKAWDTLLPARSVENLCYTIGINRIGTDPNQNSYNGHSAFYNGLGEKMAVENWEEEFVQTLTLQKSHLNETRKQFPFLNDKDQFAIKV